MLWAIGAGFAGCTAAVLYMVLRASEGHEDDTGFHYGLAVDYCDITGQPLTPRQRFDQDTGVY